jgi:hypothetical protein
MFRLSPLFDHIRARLSWISVDRFIPAPGPCGIQEGWCATASAKRKRYPLGKVATAKCYIRSILSGS